MRPKLIASELLREAAQKHQIHLSLLVADTGLRVSPEVHHRLVRDTGPGAMFLMARRARIGQGEERGNTFSSRAIRDGDSF